MGRCDLAVVDRSLSCGWDGAVEARVCVGIWRAFWPAAGRRVRAILCWEGVTGFAKVSVGLGVGCEWPAVWLVVWLLAG